MEPDRRSSQATPADRTAKLLLGLLLLAAALLRLALVLRGGQRYWPDEVRFLRSWELLVHVGSGDWPAAVDQLAGTRDHTGFTVVGLAPAALQASLLWLVDGRFDLPAIERSLWIPAALLAMASVAIVALVHAVARRAGAGPFEALLAAALAAGANTLFYYARHLLPYDAALALALAALWVGLGAPSTLRRSLACGALAGAALVVYHGYWLSAALVGALHAAAGDATLARRCRRALGYAAGAAALPSLLAAASVARGLPFYPTAVAEFSRLAATQAELSEGGSLPFAYLWHAEHGLLLAWGAGALGALALCFSRSHEATARARLWLGAVVGVYLALVVPSVGLGRIGVFGRSVRQLVPYACLATAVAAAAWLGPRPRARRVGLALALALALQSAWNFATPLAQAFPADALRQVAREHGPVARDTTVIGTERWEVPSVPWPDAGQRPLRAGQLLLLNAQHLYPVEGTRPLPPGRVLRRWRHPLEYRPYQYEGYPPRERAILRRGPISMTLIELSAAPDRSW